MKYLIKTLVILLYFSSSAYSQSPVTAHEAAGAEDFKHFRISTALYHTYIGTETSEGMELLIVPSIGLDLEYWFNDKWGLGLHNDLELVNFEIERGDEILFERETPLLLTLDALWKPNKDWVFFFGPGIELEKNKELFVVRGGMEYEIELEHHFNISPTIFYDLRKNAYDTFSLGIGVGKRF